MYVGARPTIWSDPTGQVPPSTVQCDGNGNFEIINTDTNKCTKECTQKHEESHILDWKLRYGDSACKGKQKGYLPMYGLNYESFRRMSECEAYRVSQRCLLAKKDDCDCKGDAALEADIQYVANQINCFCHNVNSGSER